MLTLFDLHRMHQKKKKKKGETHQDDVVNRCFDVLKHIAQREKNVKEAHLADMAGFKNNARIFKKQKWNRHVNREQGQSEDALCPQPAGVPGIRFLQGKETGIPTTPKQKAGKSAVDYWLGQGTYKQLYDWELNETIHGLGNCVFVLLNITVGPVTCTRLNRHFPQPCKIPWPSRTSECDLTWK